MAKVKCRLCGSELSLYRLFTTNWNQMICVECLKELEDEKEAGEE